MRSWEHWPEIGGQNSEGGGQKNRMLFSLKGLNIIAWGWKGEARTTPGKRIPKFYKAESLE